MLQEVEVELTRVALAALHVIGPCRGLLFPIFSHYFTHYFHVEQSCLSYSPHPSHQYRNQYRHVHGCGLLPLLSLALRVELTYVPGCQPWATSVVLCRAVPCCAVVWKRLSKRRSFRPTFSSVQQKYVDNIILLCKVSFLLVAMTQRETFPRSLSSQQD